MVLRYENSVQSIIKRSKLMQFAEIWDTHLVGKCLTEKKKKILIIIIMMIFKMKAGHDFR